ncbi:indole-3-glycerol phosphate synthase TrpC [Magnetospirillum sp. SS-4]|uniref:indole-3-glycerol phosphate synthase TrpC n=1 Tax=Magnetospirillum sp. SS-4 TaxID=2681465 RepID=UPI0013860206|nr:indole-3-glycerol phosphate synthase TrpC [Magnetospirillum sp. SS-4]CAA7622161.1 Indole-3-glycerol phosphate synthase [Magnetospirillum sp. SS-4]
MNATPTILDRICAEKRKQVADQKGRRNIKELLDRAKDQAPPRGFAQSLDKMIAKLDWGIIAEIKKASPSAGIIRADFKPELLARGYQRGGAACLSVLTDPKFFQGSDADLGAARSACDLPVLRKDFLVDPYQVVEARALGADAVLLIVAALSDAELAQLEEIALGYQMDVILEVHDEAEMERALRLKSPLIGINNRDLKIMKTDLATTERLAPMVPDGHVIISESGLEGPGDLKRMAQIGVKRFLIGEALMRRADVEQALKVLLAGANVAA